MTRWPILAAKAALRLARTGDVAEVARRTRAVLAARRPPAPAAPPPLAPYFGLDAAARAGFARRVERLGAAGPVISLVVPLHDTPASYLKAAIGSVLDQAYPRFQLILVDDASAAPHVAVIARAAVAADPRVRLVERQANDGVSRATNDGIARATGGWTGFLDHDDELAPDALLCVAERLAAEPGLDALYTDQLKIDGDGRVVDHHFKPDWSPAHLLGVMYVGHLLVVRTTLLRTLRGFDPAFDGVQDYELMLRLSERTDCVGHLARPLYRWRAAAGSLAADADAKPGIEALQRRAVDAHLARRGLAWRAEPHPTPTLRHRLTLAPGPKRPQVSVVIPSRDQGAAVERCLDSLFALRGAAELETIVVDDHTTDPRALAAFARHPVTRLAYDRAFNFSDACNQGAAHAGGEFVLFLNNDTQVLQADWLERLAMWLDEPDVGAVGPVLLYPDRTVQHAGVVLGARGTADHAMRGFPAQVDGYAGSLATSREVSAVTGACLMMRRAEFLSLGGFSTDYARHYQDVDLCLRLRSRGQRIVCAARPTLIHHEGLTRAAEGYDMGDRAILVDRWAEAIAAGDPYFSPWMDAQRLDYSLAA